MNNNTYNKKTVFWGACAGMLLFGICFITLGSVTIHLREKFALSDLQTGSLFAILPLGIITGSLVFGPVADRYGYKWLLLASCLCLAIGFLGIGHAGSMGVLRVCVYIFGFGGGAINGATNALVALISEEDKVANLSLLGVFFGLGSLGMPLILSRLGHSVGPGELTTGISVLALLIGAALTGLRYPPPLRSSPISFRDAGAVLRHPLALLIAFFLFLQMSLEALINNWTTSYLTGHQGIPEDRALLGLSVFVIGMTIMRVLIGSVWRKASQARLLTGSMALLLAGTLSFQVASPYVLMPGLFLLGAGMAAGVPLMLGIAGTLFKEMSGTAFSVVIVIGLLGNLGLNYLMGYLSDTYGIQFFSYALLVQWFLMVLISIAILRKNNTNSE